MFLADNIVLFPFKSILTVFQEIYKAALQEMAAESQAIRDELSQLYLALEAGDLSEEGFDARERVLLDRLDAIEERDMIEEDGEEDEEEDEGEDDDDEDEEYEEEDEDNDDETEDEDEQYKSR